MSASHAESPVDLESLVDVEQQFYTIGFADGLEHGKIHGRVEGRQLGGEKGFEMWEELGFYEGFAKLWKLLSEHGEGKDSSRLGHTATVLLDLIAHFPMMNPSQPDSDNVDIPKLLGQIRARYKMLCSIVGVKPSLRASRVQAPAASSTVGGSAGMAPSGESSSVWTVATEQKSGGVDYSF